MASVSDTVNGKLHGNSTAFVGIDGRVFVVCRTCEQRKPLEEFPLNSKGKRTKPDCRACYYSAEKKRARERWNRFYEPGIVSKGDRAIALRILATKDLRDITKRDLEFLEELPGLRESELFFYCETCGKRNVRGFAAKNERYCRNRDGTKTKCDLNKKKKRYRVMRSDATRICRCCGQTKKAGKFVRDKTIPGGRRNTCNSCRYKLKLRRLAKRKADERLARQPLQV